MITTAATSVEPPHAHKATVAHHFASAQQQFDAGKLGMWLFLVTEVLFFSGLFVAYAVYRSSHPEVFLDAHKYLNTTLGAFNTLVLLLSSLTMAWSVRSAQLGQHKLLVVLLAATLACAGLFLGVKAVEYGHKWGEGLLWAGAFSADAAEASPAETRDVHRHITQALLVLSIPATVGAMMALTGIGIAQRRKKMADLKFWCSMLLCGLAYFVGLGVGQFVEQLSAGSSAQDAAIHVNAVPSPGASESPAGIAPNYTGVFFSIYYAMTGVHAIHILVGMGVIAWLLRRSLRGDFGPDYFGPVDYVGLYWHLVDLVWIYLFPLLYLIR